MITAFLLDCKGILKQSKEKRPEYYRFGGAPKKNHPLHNAMNFGFLLKDIKFDQAQKSRAYGRKREQEL